MMINGKYVGDWAWAERKESAFQSLRTAYDDALNVAKSALSKHDELKQSKELTPSGVKAEAQRWMARGGAGGLVAAKIRIANVRQEVETRRANLQKQGPDKTDVAGALMRQEIRTHLRSLDAAARVAMLQSDNVAPEVALAVIEAPSVLSGVSDNLRNGLINQSMEALNPGEVEILAELESALEAAQNAVRAANHEVKSATGLADYEVDKLLEGVRPEPSRLKRYGSEIKVIVESPAGGYVARPATAEEIETGRFVDPD